MMQVHEKQAAKLRLMPSNKAAVERFYAVVYPLADPETGEFRLKVVRDMVRSEFTISDHKGAITNFFFGLKEHGALLNPSHGRYRIPPAKLAELRGKVPGGEQGQGSVQGLLALRSDLEALCAAHERAARLPGLREKHAKLAKQLEELTAEIERFDVVALASETARVLGRVLNRLPPSE